MRLLPNRSLIAIVFLGIFLVGIHVNGQEQSLVSMPATELSTSPGLLSTTQESAKSLPHSWESGLTIEDRVADLEKKLAASEKAKSKLPNVTINGVFQTDGVLFHQDQASDQTYGFIENGADFRRARLSAKGAVAENMNYFMQMDFGFFGRPTFTDVWTEWTQLPVLGNVRVGQWKQPFGLEVVSSFRYTTFMERSSSFQAFTPFRHIGVGFYDHASDLNSTWACSYFRTGQDQFGGSLSTDGGNGIAGRFTRLLGFDPVDGTDYLHLGVGYFLNAPPNDRARFRSIPEIFVGEFAPAASSGTSGQAIPAILNGTPFFVDTGVLNDVESVNTFGLESLWVRGPFSWQTEAMVALVSQASARDSVFSGTYSQIGYFLTGEHRPYDRKNGAIDRVLPHQNFSRFSGLGAWEIAVRWSTIDLNDDQILGGMMQNLTSGINWYANPYCKCSVNHIHSWVSDFRSSPFPSTETDAIGMRCQLDF